MKKADAEKGIRALCTEWAGTLPPEKLVHPSFSAFTSWLEAKGHGSFLDFKSTTGARYDAAMWFDDELGQSWRN